MEFKDYYKVMGVARDATEAQIKQAYRKLARKYHPDVSKEKDAEARFKEVGEAYEVLRSPEKRAAYDQLGQDLPPARIFVRRPIGEPASSSAVRAEAMPTTAIFSKRCSAHNHARARAVMAARSMPDAAKTTTPKCCWTWTPRCAAAPGSSACGSLRLTRTAAWCRRNACSMCRYPKGILAGQHIRSGGPGRAASGRRDGRRFVHRS